MSCWNILKIEPTHDVKVIKQAYAKLLKVNRPDEAPEAFKALREAYQQAINYTRHVKASESESAEKPSQSQQEPEVTINESEEVDHTLRLKEACEEIQWKSECDFSAQDGVYQQDILNDASEETSERIYETLDLNTEWDRLVVAIDQALYDRKSANNSESWLFLFASEGLIDIDFKQQLSFYLFSKLYEYSKEFGIPTVAIVDRLEALFQWRQQLDILGGEYSDDFVERLLFPEKKYAIKLFSRENWLLSRQQSAPKESGSYYMRLLGTLVDIIIVFLLAKSLHTIVGSLTPVTSDFILSCIGAYLLIAPLFESSRMQGTPGKVLLGLKVVNKEGKRLHFLRSYLRHILFLFSSGLFKITVWINLFVFAKEGKLIHDYLSGSHVVKRH